MYGEFSVQLPSDPAQAACARRLLATSFAAYGLGADEWHPLGADAFRVTVRQRIQLPGFDNRLEIARMELLQRAADYALAGFRIASYVEDRKIVRSVRRRKDRARFVHERLHVAVSG
jgi:hypothetical protein